MPGLFPVGDDRAGHCREIGRETGFSLLTGGSSKRQREEKSPKDSVKPKIYVRNLWMKR